MVLPIALKCLISCADNGQDTYVHVPLGLGLAVKINILNLHVHKKMQIILSVDKNVVTYLSVST